MKTPEPCAPTRATMARIAGVDEAGRGPLAGPVVVAAVILDPSRPIAGIADSKALDPAQRAALAPLIRAHALAWSVAVVDTDEIERLNILGATLAGMARALAALAPAPSLALIDGNRLPKSLPCPARSVVGGDASEPAIGAASILAKTTRDALMCELDAIHPGYGFAQHKGYPTPEHLAALERLGPCPIHRRGFAPVRRLLAPSLFAEPLR
ncbi:MAG: ribonuclease HII [Dokdonella sp.]|uniref:ribonuclease HII n=1 Tax=Dokdonella sp. TaxID=2291710 RepID=UPI0025BFEB67|nr:ribonuclease HII [Dokdonella sp.]MBX3699504.1 ribonuclease HII [Dokdonella sp.]MCW5577806.1 ribonuclease HII [Dokdonella sp.]